MDLTKLKFIAEQFLVDSKILNIKEITSGKINSTYLIECLNNEGNFNFILQKLSNIFYSHQIVNRNHSLITDHMKNNLNNVVYKNDDRRWEVPDLIKCANNDLFIYLFEGDSWRALKYIDSTMNLSKVNKFDFAYEVGYGLSKFHLICSDFDSSNLEPSINNFHDTPYYIDQYINIFKGFDFSKLSDQVNYRVQVINGEILFHLKTIKNIINYLRNKQLDNFVIHGDPKLSNFLFDKDEKFVVSLIDLDTVSSGPYLIDLADCIRSLCNLLDEDPPTLKDVYFDMRTCKKFLDGYFYNFKKDKFGLFNFLPQYIYLITFELTIRFLTDFLKFNVYFKTNYDTQNLYRAEVQIKFLASFLSQNSIFKVVLKEIGIPQPQPI